MHRPTGFPEKLWAVSVSVAALLFAALQLASISVRGLGVGIRGGEFILRQGRVVEDVNQGLGLFLYILGPLSVLSIIWAGLVSAWVSSLHGFARPSELLRRVESRGLRTTVLVSLSVLVLSLVAVAMAAMGFSL